MDIDEFSVESESTRTVGQLLNINRKVGVVHTVTSLHYMNMDLLNKSEVFIWDERDRHRKSLFVSFINKSLK